jgi:general secretion pathway protein I
MDERLRGKGGFTLLEVLVALAILSGTLVLAYQVMSGAIAAEERSERWTAAAFLGESLLRENLSPFPEIAKKEGRFPSPDDEYSWKLLVKQALHNDAREVHVSVKWGEGDREETVALAGIAVK